MADGNVLLEAKDGVATVTLNRPAVFNALNQEMAEALVRAIEACGEDGNTRAVILTGAGRGFCAGGDMKAAWAHIQAGGDPGHFFRDLTVPLHRVISDLRLMEKPVIAAIESARFKQAYTSIGLVPDGGWTAIVPQIIGPAKAAELLLLDPLLDAQQALAMGLVHEVVSDDQLAEHVQAVASGLAQGRASAFGAAKALLNAALFPHLEVQLERERQRIIAQGGTAAFRERLGAFIDKHKS
mgnify:CR=1 FL=1